MDELLQSMGERLVQRRKQLRLTQEELAGRADMTAQTISTAETGRKALRPHNIVKLCRALEISADYLLFGKISDGDTLPLSAEFSQWTPDQYHYLEDIINSFIAAVNTNHQTESET